MKLRKSPIILILTLLLFVSLSLSYAAEKKFVGSKKSDKYHYLTCKWAAKIKPENAIYFESVKDAKAKSYVPCKVCKPPAE